jgi:hypothetical protein
VSELLRSLAAVLKTSAAATDGEASDGEGQNADGAFVEGHVQGRNASSEARRSDRADVGADELMAACSSLDSETDSAVAKVLVPAVSLYARPLSLTHALAHSNDESAAWRVS